MTRPAVSVILPFHGSAQDAAAAIAAVASMRRSPGDEIIVVDNTGAGVVPESGDVRVLRAAQQPSAYYARNEGAAAAAGEWLLFVDGDCRPRPDLLDRYFDEPADERCGALVGEIVGVPGQDGLVPRYARSRKHLGQELHWRYPFRPFGVTANLLVRRAAWESVGGFQEGIRSTGDVEFCWRIQDAGWTMGFRPHAIVEHEHRDSVRALVRQAARYGAGQAWIRRRYPEGMPPMRLPRPLARAVAGVVAWTLTGQLERAAFKGLDGLYAVVGRVAQWLPNRPPVPLAPPSPAAAVVVADRWPELGGATTGSGIAPGTHVEALGRPIRVDRALARSRSVAYAEDDSGLERLAACAWLALRSPGRVAGYALARRKGAVPPLADVAPGARRARATGAREIRALGPASEPRADALRRLAGR